MAYTGWIYIMKTCSCNILCKIDNFQMKRCDIFLIFAQNIDCGYIEGSDEYPQSMFWSKNKKKCIPL